jgi:hypothetical protein
MSGDMAARLAIVNGELAAVYEMATRITAERDALRAEIERLATAADRIADHIEALDGRPCQPECRHEDCEVIRAVAAYRAIRQHGPSTGEG